MPAPFVQILDVPVPQMGNQLVQLLQLFDTQTPVEQFTAVPKISQDSTVPRVVDCRRPQLAEQLVEVPTVLSLAFLQQQTAEQIIDIPVPRGRGNYRGLQGLSPGQGSLQRTVDFPVPGGDFHVLPDSGWAAPSAVSRDGRGQRVFAHLFPISKSAESAEVRV